MKFKKAVLGCLMTALLTPQVYAAVTADKAAQLGSVLTDIGAEKAGNADGSIPEYNGGLKTPPPQYKKGSGVRPDPFADEKPLVSITAANMSAYDSKLTMATKELLKRFPDTFRVDLYPTHRTAAFPEYVIDNTKKNATSAVTTDGGLGLKNAYPGYPFPIPQNGYEVMWNHLLRFVGVAVEGKYDTINVDLNGQATLATTGIIRQEFPIYDPAKEGMIKEDDTFTRLTIHYTAPARRAGESIMSMDFVNSDKHPRRAWQYLPGQRRVKLAPSISYDTPNPGTAGMSTYDDTWTFNGAMDRFNFKLIGKKELIVPYNSYKLVYESKGEDVIQGKHLNPDAVRWELHRVWVVEATLKPGKRHIYSKRIFYVDEDSWVALTSDQYDARDQLYRAGFSFYTTSYEIPAPQMDTMVVYDFVAGSYSLTGANTGPYGGNVQVPMLPDRDWSPDALAGAGVR
tara:strand:- start:15436 stop:16803 length:1368 start_codon:yes stop_codon:yes gene_type:complete